jgi:hypothetical protein
MNADRDAIGALLLGLVEQGVTLHQVAIGPVEENRQQLRLALNLPPKLPVGSLSPWLSRQPGVVQFEWE